MAAGYRHYIGVANQDGAFYTGLTHHTTQDELAQVTVRQGESMDSPRFGWLRMESSLLGGSAQWSLSLPRVSQVFVPAAGGSWAPQCIRSGDYPEGDVTYAEPPRAYEAGERYEITCNTGVYGPMIGEGDGLVRDGDTISGTVNLFADGAGHHGEGELYYGADSTTLYRDGEEYATADGIIDESTFEVPAGIADYELVTTARRGGVAADVSTEVTASYTFTSARTDERTPLPASAIRFTPDLALDSTAPAGETMTVPVTVQGSAAGGPPGSLTVSVSTDGGETCLEVPVENGAIQVTNPAAGGTVSFRAEAVDADGNTTTQTIIDAYRTR
ncbi:hypothetical protein [Streptomyces sp. 6N223]|uniref:hypothetical protein n=1 Tax=Streptomyces sp. 6N223 TaxID=3457412 RepID=UPI003FD3F3EC